MKDIKNIYDYDLNQFKTLLINENNEILGGFDSKSKLKIGDIFRLPQGKEMEILEEKKIFIVKEL